GLGEGEPEIEPIGDGHSNVTYVLRRGSTEIVIRRPPRGPLPPSAHDVLREARVLRALEGRAPVPRVLDECDDAGVIGVPFYVMARIHGEVVHDAVPPVLDTEAERRRMGEQLVDALVTVHAVDWRAAGLEGFGRPDGYLERQIRRFSGLWEQNRTRELPAMERVAGWLGEHMPDSPPATIVHGDYRLGNVMYAPAPPARLVAIFDWEMSTIGDPLADLGYLCTFWVDRDDPPAGIFEQHALTRAPGWPTRAELIARYEERSGRSMSDFRWYQAMALWKIIVFMEGNYRRALAGSVDDPYLTSFGEAIAGLADRAEAFTR
ncbi:MAG TPA: phosphotransferase family protein, partial [Solirubrobacteraceae bacterium]|nr:phosphotransferase family protein [Solirubrobacteraceae bacterium]